MFRTAFTFLTALGFASSAVAGTTFTATLETPRDKLEKIVAVEVMWSCIDETCTAELARKSVNINTCKKVVKQIGKVVEFSTENGDLSEADLAACNSAAK